MGCVPMQGLIGVTLSAGVPALQDGSHVNRAAFYMGFLYIIAIGLPVTPALLCCQSMCLKQPHICLMATLAEGLTLSVPMTWT